MSEPVPPEEHWYGVPKGFATGVGEGVVGLVKGVKDLVVMSADGWRQMGGLAKELVTDPQTRDTAWQYLKENAREARDFAKYMADDPLERLRTARDGVLAAKRWVDDKTVELLEQESAKLAEARRLGRANEYWSKLAGRGSFEIATMLTGAGGAAKLGQLGKVAKAEKLLSKVEMVTLPCGKVVAKVEKLAEAKLFRLEKNVRLDPWRESFGKPGEGYAALIKDLPKHHATRNDLARAIREMRREGVAVRRGGNEMGPTIGVFGGESIEQGMWFRYNAQKLRVIDMMEELVHWEQMKKGMPLRGYTPETLERLAKQSLLSRKDLPAALRAELKDDLARVKRGDYFKLHPDGG